MRLPTFSGIQRAMLCPASAALPRAERVTERQARGTAMHTYLAAVGKVGREAALALVPDEYRPICEAIQLEDLPACEPDAWVAEIALAYNVDTGEAKELGRDIGRAYPWDRQGRWLFGTVDVAGVARDPSTVVAVDYKGSLWTPAARAERNWQLRAGALALSRLWGRSRAAVAIVKIDDYGEPHWDPAVLDDFSLAMAAAELQELADRIEVAEAAVREGKPVPWLTTSSECEWCPALQACPAHLALAREVAVAPEQVAEQVDALLTPENAPAAYRRLREIERVAKAVRAGLEAFARQMPFDVEPGVRFGPRPYSRETLLGDVVQAALEKAFDGDFAKDVVTPEATKEALKKAVRRWKERTRADETLKALEEKALTAIRAAGGAKKQVTYPVGEYEPKEAA
jgi:hypothetical protein